MDLYEELRDVVKALNHRGLDYAICGGVALALHGHPRFTDDIDILILPDDLDEIQDAAKSCGFLDSSGRIPFEQCDVHRIVKNQGAEFLVLDLLLVNDVLEEIWQSRVDFDWQEERLRVVSAEGLASMKRMAGRDQDLVDLKNMGIPDGNDRTEQSEPPK